MTFPETLHHMIRDKLSSAWGRVKEDAATVVGNFLDQPIHLQITVVALIIAGIGISIPTYGLALPISLPAAIVLSANLMED